MLNLDMENAVKDIPSLRGVFITIMPDALLFDSWIREKESWVAEEASAYFGDLARSNREGLKALQSWSSDMQVTIESSDILLIIRELKEDFVIGVVFDRKAPLGMVRLYLKRLIERIEPALPTTQIETRSKAVKIIEFLKRYAPDPHAVFLRTALIMQIEVEQFDDPGSFSDSQAEELEKAAKEILGLDTINV